MNITDEDMQAIVTRLLDYCHLLEVVEGEFGYTDASEQKMWSEVAATKELINRLTGNEVTK